MNQDDILKLKSVFLYILNKQRFIDQFHLFKILYFADRNHLAKYGRRIIKDTFCALEYGPVPSSLYDMIKIKNGQKISSKFFKEKIFSPLLDSFITGSGDAYYYLQALELPDMDELSKSDIDCLDESFEKYYSADMSKLSNESHDEAWQTAWNRKQNSPINHLDMAKAAGATDDFIHYIQEIDEVTSCLL